MSGSVLLTVAGVRGASGEPFPPPTRTFTTASVAAPDDDAVWDPVAENRFREWSTNRPECPWQRLPRLMAPPGVTAVSGQVLRLNGAPLAGVTLRLAGRSVTTDATGRFLLVHEDLATGWHELWMDGRTATRGRATYGTFEVAVRVTAGETTVLPYTSWMPQLDTAHAVRIASPTATETLVTTPLIPGLELRLAPGTVVTDEDGRTVREVSITPIPIDRTPFPLPVGVEVPIYFTIQPGGAYVAVTGTNGGVRGARLIYHSADTNGYKVETVTTNPATALAIVHRIEMLADFRRHPAVLKAAQEAVPVTMPRDVGGLGFDVPLWTGLGIVGLWAALDAFYERAGLPDSRCTACSRSCIAARFSAHTNATDAVSLSELDDLRHLYAHNYAGEADDEFFKVKRRHVLVRSSGGVALSCGAVFDGSRVWLEAEHLRFYAGTARKILERFL